MNNFSLFYKLAEVPGAASVNLHPAEHLLFCKEFSKMCPSALRVSGPPGPRRVRELWSKPSLERFGDVSAKFYQDSLWGLDFH